MLIVFDLDGTLADCSHRQKYVNGELGKKDWKTFFSLIPYDSPIDPIRQILDLFYSQFKSIGGETNTALICTARPSDYLSPTVQWLAYHRIRYDKIYFRKSGDHRDDTIVKREMLNQIIKDYGKKPDLVFDDRKRVVDMWRENGIQCCQVAPGDF